MSQRDLSGKLGRAQNYVHKLEIGERKLEFLEAIDLAEALGLDPFDLLDRVLSYGKPARRIEPIVVSAKRKKRRQK